MKVSFTIHNLPFKHPFTISKGTKTHQPTFVVSLHHMGHTGYGEAPAIAYYNIPVDKMASDLEYKLPMLEKFTFTDPERYWHYLHHLFPQNSFLVCALDMAGWDLFGKMRRQPLYKLWGLDTSLAPPTDFTIGIDSVDIMLQKMKEQPWPIYKIKMGAAGDMEMIKALRATTDAIFRIDANAGWGREEALQKIALLKDLNVELVEQPIAKDDWEGMKILFENAALPLFADEACVAEADVLQCQHYFHGINIKLTKCGGITPAKRMIAKAKELGMKVMLGCMNESTIGSAAITHLAPMVDHVDMDGPLLLAEDVATGVDYNNGTIIYNDFPGLGIEMIQHAK